MESYQIIWNNAKNELKNTVSTINYSMYIDTFEPIDIVGYKLVLMTRSEIFASFAQKNLLNKIKAALDKINSGIKDVEIFVGTSKEDYKSVTTTELPELEGSPIDPNYTFENFVVGDCNSFCYAASKAVAEDPGNSYNPLFIYGSSGLGKTHLLHAIFNDLKKRSPKKKVLYVTSEKFYDDFISIIRSGKAYSENGTTSFKNRYRNVDVLIIDDVQAFQTKQKSMDELFHTFNDLYSMKKQIILSSDRQPKDLDMDDRLRTRFEGGLLAEVLIPDIETKIAILQKKAENKKQILPLDVATYIAEHSDNNVRSLEGLLNKVIFASRLKEAPITLQLCYDALKEGSNAENKECISSTRIIDTVCAYYKVSKEDVLSKKRNKELVEPRQICCYLMATLMAIPLETIGQAIGGRDYSTVIHSRDKITKLIAIDDRIATDVNDIRNLILKK